MRVFLKPE
ncbi:hypothetical protein VCHENC02_1965A, partial [Vibrio harveyi]